MVGSKGIDLFGALAVGAVAEIASRRADSRETWVLHLSYERLDEGAALELARRGLALPGTRVTVRDVTETARKVLTPQKMAAYLREQLERAGPMPR